MIDCVIDTVSLNHLSIPGKANERVDDITIRIRARRLRVVVDKMGALIDEWRRTTNEEKVKIIISHWQENGGLVRTKKTPSMPRELKEALRKLGFTDAADKLVVSIALLTTDRNIVSSDSDFFDPTKKESIGDKTAPVARLLKEMEEIDVHTIKDIVAKVPHR